MGAVPDWYLVIRAARYLGVAPWEMLEQPSLWLGWALASERAENEAAAERQKLAQQTE